MVAPDRDRLRRAFGLQRPADAERGAARAPGADLRAFLQRRQEQFGGRSERGEVVELPPGEEGRNDHGVFWRRSLRYPLTHRHGAVELGRVAGLDGAALAALDRRGGLGDGSDLCLERCLFLDTETTGLGGGAGTTVFLVGVGWVEDDAVTVLQCFLRDFAEEPAMLAHLALLLAQHPLLVTYVGKSYDRHRLAARLSVNRVEAPILDAPHLDLYHVARRAWGKQLPDCRLQTVEQHRLGLRRDDDLPGSEAPAAWLGWLRDRRGPVDRVLEHNRLDVLSLVALLGVLAGR